jgi:hypothetical protein
MKQRPKTLNKTLIVLSITSAIILLAYPLANNTIIFNSVFGLDSSIKPSSVQNNNSSQTEQEKHQQRGYNATNVLISTIKSTQSILAKALNDINMNNTIDAQSDTNALNTKIEQYQLSALDVLSNPIFESSRIHLAKAEDAIKSGNIEKATSELSIAGQLRIQHQQGMMEMKLPMRGEMNSTFNSLEAHLLAANEAVNAGYTQKALSELNMANDQLYPHQLSMIDFINSIFNNTRTHLKLSIDDLRDSNRQAAISELNTVGQLLKTHQQGMLTMMGL